ncbi:MAG: thioredoxin family protein [Candidatus Thorarchaeota archaeon]|nr:thioredoxin family protein [Candidatus Thorarchaeota archaeon]
MTPAEKPEGSNVEDMTKRLEMAMAKDEKDQKANGELNALSSMKEVHELRQSRTAVLEFYRQQCPHCKRLMPIMEELASDYEGKVFFAKVNIDDVPRVRESFEVFGVPLVVALKRGMPVARIEGFHDIEVYDDWISKIHSGMRPMDLATGPETELL